MEIHAIRRLNLDFSAKAVCYALDAKVPAKALCFSTEIFSKKNGPFRHLRNRWLRCVTILNQHKHVGDFVFSFYRRALEIRGRKTNFCSHIRNLQHSVFR